MAGLRAGSALGRRCAASNSASRGARAPMTVPLHVDSASGGSVYVTEAEATPSPSSQAEIHHREAMLLKDGRTLFVAGTLCGVCLASIVSLRRRLPFSARRAM